MNKWYINGTIIGTSQEWSCGVWAVRSKSGGVMTIMANPLKVSICKVCKLGLLVDGKMGINGELGKNRAACIKLALKYTGKN